MTTQTPYYSGRFVIRVVTTPVDCNKGWDNPRIWASHARSWRLSVTYLSLICQDAPPEQRSRQRSRQRLQQPRAMCVLHAALEATAARAAAPAGSGRRGPGGWRTCRRRCGLWARRQHHARRPRRTRAARRTSSRAAASHAPRRACESRLSNSSGSSGPILGGDSVPRSRGRPDTHALSHEAARAAPCGEVRT